MSKVGQDLIGDYLTSSRAYWVKLRLFCYFSVIKEESCDLNGLDVFFSRLLSLIFIRNTVDLEYGWFEELYSSSGIFWKILSFVLHWSFRGMNEDSPEEPGTLPGMHKCPTVFSFRSPPPPIFHGVNLVNFFSSPLQKRTVLLEQQQCYDGPIDCINAGIVAMKFMLIENLTTWGYVTKPLQGPFWNTVVVKRVQQTWKSMELV